MGRIVVTEFASLDGVMEEPRWTFDFDRGKEGDVAAEVAAIKDQPGGDLLVEGSARLVHALAQHGLVDEYRLMVFPVILGQGRRVFPDSMPAPARLTVTDWRTVGSGVLLLRLRPQLTASGGADPAGRARPP